MSRLVRFLARRAASSVACLLGLASLALVASGALAATPGAPNAMLAHTVNLEIAHGVKMQFVLIAPGKFLMGSDPNFSDGDETPQHQVTLTRPFYLGINEVTQAQWSAVMASNPSRFVGTTRPVDNVSWNDCQAFVARLTQSSGRRVRLPTEAEWEYACRAGTTTRWYFGEDESALTSRAWCVANANGTTHAVGTRPPNPWGLFDMYGNIWEWCSDWYANPYPASAATDPTGPASGVSRVLRGGAWGDDPSQVRSGYRNSMGPDQHNAGTGFRCVLEVP